MDSSQDKIWIIDKFDLYMLITMALFMAFLYFLCQHGACIGGDPF